MTNKIPKIGQKFTQEFSTYTYKRVYRPRSYQHSWIDLFSSKQYFVAKVLKAPKRFSDDIGRLFPVHKRIKFTIL